MWGPSLGALTDIGMGEAAVGCVGSVRAKLLSFCGPLIRGLRLCVVGQSMAEASPKEVDIPIANVDKGINGIARYVVVVITGDGRRWAISKRFSDFHDLKMELAKLEVHLKNGMLVRDLAFPPKQLWGGSGDEIIALRIPALRRWVNNILKLAPESRDFGALISMFLAEDHSVDQRTLRLIGLNEDRLMSTGRASAGAAPRQLVRLQPWCIASWRTRPPKLPTCAPPTHPSV